MVVTVLSDHWLAFSCHTLLAAVFIVKVESPPLILFWWGGPTRLASSLGYCLTQCIHYMVLESPPPHQIDNLLF